MLVKPRIIMPLDYRLISAPQLQLAVRSLRGVEDAECYTLGVAHEIPELRNDDIGRRLVVAALCKLSGDPLTTYEDLGGLPSAELSTLAAVVSGALDGISPTHWRCNVTEWIRVLSKGALHVTNRPEVLAIVHCGDVAIGYSGGNRTPRPDRYFGMPVSDLTDGQRMAIEAAHEAYEELGKVNG